MSQQAQRMKRCSLCHTHLGVIWKESLEHAVLAQHLLNLLGTHQVVGERRTLHARWNVSLAFSIRAESCDKRWCADLNSVGPLDELAGLPLVLGRVVVGRVARPEVRDGHRHAIAGVDHNGER